MLLVGIALTLGHDQLGASEHVARCDQCEERGNVGAPSSLSARTIASPGRFDDTRGQVRIHLGEWGICFVIPVVITSPASIVQASTPIVRASPRASGTPLIGMRDGANETMTRSVPGTSNHSVSGVTLRWTIPWLLAQSDTPSTSCRTTETRALANFSPRETNWRAALHVPDH